MKTRFKIKDSIEFHGLPQTAKDFTIIKVSIFLRNQSLLIITERCSSIVHEIRMIFRNTPGYKEKKVFKKKKIVKMPQLPDNYLCRLL